MASLYGWNSLEFLALSNEDRRIAVAVLRERIRIEEERRKRELDYVAAQNAALITNWLAKAFG